MAQCPDCKNWAVQGFETYCTCTPQRTFKEIPVRFRIGDETVELEVSDFWEYPRGPDGTCALCCGDPCNETSPHESLIARWWAANPHSETCPVCLGRPT